MLLLFVCEGGCVYVFYVLCFPSLSFSVYLVYNSILNEWMDVRTDHGRMNEFGIVVSRKCLGITQYHASVLTCGIDLV